MGYFFCSRVCSAKVKLKPRPRKRNLRLLPRWRPQAQQHCNHDEQCVMLSSVAHSSRYWTLASRQTRLIKSSKAVAMHGECTPMKQATCLPEMLCNLPLLYGVGLFALLFSRRFRVLLYISCSAHRFGFVCFPGTGLSCSDYVGSVTWMFHLFHAAGRAFESCFCFGSGLDACGLPAHYHEQVSRLPLENAWLPQPASGLNSLLLSGTLTRGPFTSGLFSKANEGRVATWTSHLDFSSNSLAPHHSCSCVVQNSPRMRI
jgi:hypothetical protein